MHIGVNGTLEASIGAAHPGCYVEPTDREAGEYHPRMYQGTYRVGSVPLSPTEDAEFALASEQEDVLLRDLVEICRVVAPDVSTHQAYGTRIRNLLIMACTEIEAQWRGILNANGYHLPQRPNTTDYVKLCAPLRLPEYVLRCQRFRSYPLVCPFKTWTTAQSSKSLVWYDAYNATKHDRVGAFSRATLQNAIDAAAALCVMLVAQYGTAYLSSDATDFFGLTSAPRWRPAEQTYDPPRGSRWSPVPFQF